MLQLAVRIGEAMLSLGAAAADVTEAIRRVARSFGVRCEVDLTFTAILVSHDPGPGAPPVTVLRVVESRTADYGRLTRVLELAADLGDGAGGHQPGTTPSPPGSVATTPEAVDRRVERAHDLLDEIVSAPHPYRRSVVTAVLSAMAAGVAVLLGGGVWVVLVAAATTAVIDVVVTRLGRWGLPPFFLQAAGAAIATLVAVLLLVLVPLFPVELSTLPPSLVVASGIVVLLAGLSLVGAAEDAINGFPVTASARVFEVVLLTLGIVVGIGAVLDAARRLDVPFALVDVRSDPAPLWLQIIGAGVVAGAWAMSSYARPRAALLAATVGGGSWLLFTVLSGLGAGPAVASAGAAVAVGFVAETISRRTALPAIVTSVCGIVPLLPGLTIYRGLFTLIDESAVVGAGLQTLLQAATVGFGLAAGVTLGELLARPVRLRIRRARLPLQTG
ncbi:threonine/serine exporter ThrE family protein [uncultured Cellulomonas sp.]|uniref:threonine/serine ThrE exporter family protein n=1 Tax=uncultured Cellulomonas sp. TaxID=189682 RepID=UPI002617C9FC|nr:threonine/serine exporter family protein [uncultured Cellulomonas sp.]